MERKPRKRKEDHCPIKPNELREFMKDALSVWRGIGMQLLKIHRQLNTLITEGGEIMVTFEDVKNKVRANTNAVNSMLVVLQAIVEKLNNCSTVPEFEAVAAELDSSTQALVDAAAENTPAENPPA